MEFPYLIEARSGSGDLPAWLRSDDGAALEQILAERGAVLFRGFDVHGPATFARVVGQLIGEPMGYRDGASPRTPLGPGVYSSTNYPQQLVVAPHNELSYSHQWPARLAFCCDRPAASGGQTPIADSRNVFARLVDTPAETVIALGVQYERHMRRDSGPGVPWSTVFDTSDPVAVETYCTTAGIGVEWLPDEGLRTRQNGPGAVRHPQTGEAVWFNQAHQWHPSNAGEENEAILREAYGRELPMNAMLGDGSELDASVLTAIRHAYRDELIMFDWREGDVMILDNMLVAHGRMPFEGDRRVLVSLGAPIALSATESL